MQHLEVSGAVRPIYGSLGVKLLIKENKMGGASSTNGGREIHTGFWGEDLREKNHVEDLSVERKIIY